MTRSDFINNVTEWWQLLDFCRDEDCSICEDIYHDDDLDNMIDDDISNAVADRMGWREIRDRLNDLDRSYNYYSFDGYMVYVGLNDDDFDDYKNQVLEWMDDGDCWEDGDDEYEDEEVQVFHTSEEADDDDDPIPEEDFSVTELVSMCILDVTIQQSENAKKKADEQAEIDRALAELLPLF